MMKTNSGVVDHQRVPYGLFSQLIHWSSALLMAMEISKKATTGQSREKTAHHFKLCKIVNSLLLLQEICCSNYSWQR